MSDFHARLIAVAEQLGAEDVRLERMGDGAGGFHRHPHIAGTIAGYPFRFPVPGSARDTRRRGLNYVGKIRRFLMQRGGTLSPKAPAPAERPETATAMPRACRRARRLQGRPGPRLQAAAGGGPTRLDCDPWAKLQGLRERMAGDETGAGGPP